MAELTKIELQNGKFILTLPTGETHEFESIMDTYIYLLNQ